MPVWRPTAAEREFDDVAAVLRLDARVIDFVGRALPVVERSLPCVFSFLFLGCCFVGNEKPGSITGAGLFPWICDLFSRRLKRLGFSTEHLDEMHHSFSHALDVQAISTA